MKSSLHAARLVNQDCCRKPIKGAVMNLPRLGIDIAKVKFNACLLLLTGKLKHKVFPNNAAGFRLRDCLRFAAAVFRE